MWIKWMYNDHGNSGFSELEVPDDVQESYGSVENYICDMDLVPTWSERFDKCRIKWKKITPSRDTLLKEIEYTKNKIKWAKSALHKYELLLKKHYEKSK